MTNTIEQETEQDYKKLEMLARNDPIMSAGLWQIRHMGVSKEFVYQKLLLTYSTQQVELREQLVKCLEEVKNDTNT